MPDRYFNPHRGASIRLVQYRFHASSTWRVHPAFRKLQGPFPMLIARLVGTARREDRRVGFCNNCHNADSGFHLLLIALASVLLGDLGYFWSLDIHKASLGGLGITARHLTAAATGPTAGRTRPDQLYGRRELTVRPASPWSVGFNKVQMVILRTEVHGAGPWRMLLKKT
jgi:hypothetical protein